MDYVEWKKPYLTFEGFFIIKNRQLSIPADDVFDDHEEVVGSEANTDEMGKLHR